MTDPERVEEPRPDRLRRYWYRLYLGSCPICGRDKSYKERVYGKRPKHLALRYIVMTDGECYDNCLG